MYDSSVGEHNSNNYGLLWFMVRKELLVFLGLINQLITFGAPTLYEHEEILLNLCILPNSP